MINGYFFVQTKSENYMHRDIAVTTKKVSVLSYNASQTKFERKLKPEWNLSNSIEISFQYHSSTFNSFTYKPQMHFPFIDFTYKPVPLHSPILHISWNQFILVKTHRLKRDKEKTSYKWSNVDSTQSYKLHIWHIQTNGSTYETDNTFA
jgi:hypothetical protein